MIEVGAIAARSRRAGETPLSKYCFSREIPAGLGAFAMMVNPPPVTAPATTAYLSPSLNPGTSVAS